MTDTTRNTSPDTGLAAKLRHNAKAHSLGIPLARRMTGSQLSQAADAIEALTARVEKAEAALAAVVIERDAANLTKTLFVELHKDAEARVAELERALHRIEADEAYLALPAALTAAPDTARQEDGHE